MSFIEKFQANNDVGTNLDSAYSNTVNNLNNTIYNSNSSDGASSNGGSASNSSNTSGTSGGVLGSDNFNLWSLLGFDTLREEQRECLYNCAIDSTSCLENATSRNCEYKCYRGILNCSKKCYELPEPTQSTQTLQSTQSSYPSQSTQSTQHIHGIPLSKNEIRGIYTNSDYFAPYDADLWPSQSNSGWDDEKLDNYFHDLQNRDDTIEVRVNTSLYPIKTDKPDLLF